MNWLIIVFIISIITTCVLFIVDKRLYGVDGFSPGKIVILFSIPSNCVLFFLGMNNERIDEYIYSRIPSLFHDDYNLIYAATLSVFSFVLVFIGLYISASTRYRASIYSLIWPKLYLDNKHGSLSKVCLGVGTLLVLFLIMKLGGIFSYWNSIGDRVNALAGYGYITMLYKFLVTFGGVLYCTDLISKKRFFTFVVSVSFISVLLVITGSRSNLLSFIVSIFIFYHYKINPVRIFNIRNLTLGILIVIFLLGFVKLRADDAIETYSENPTQLITDMSESVESQVLMRFSRLERDVVIIKYFEMHQHWLGTTYLSLLTSPIPRGLYQNKPPIDSGLYLVKMAGGGEANPPEKIDDLPAYSWPVGNMEAFMNFGLIGFILINILSGYVLGSIYKYAVDTKYEVVPVFIYSLIAFGGAPALSNMGIVNLITFFVFGGLVSYMSKVKLSK